MRTKRLAATGLAALSLTLSLSACGGDEEAEDTATDAATQEEEGGVIAPTSAPSADPTPTETPEGSDDSGISINQGDAGSGTPEDAPASDPSASASPDSYEGPGMNEESEGNPGFAAPDGTEEDADSSDSAPGSGETGAPSDADSSVTTDGSSVTADIVADTPIYAAPDTSSEKIGEAAAGGQFQGTIVEGGAWIQINRSPGFVKSDALSFSAN